MKTLFLAGAQSDFTIPRRRHPNLHVRVLQVRASAGAARLESRDRPLSPRFWSVHCPNNTICSSIEKEGAWARISRTREVLADTSVLARRNRGAGKKSSSNMTWRLRNARHNKKFTVV